VLLDIFAEHAVVLFFDNRVALARRCLDPTPVEHYDLSACAKDEACVLQMIGRKRDALAADAEQIGDLLVGHDKCRRLLMIVIHQYPAAKLLVDIVQPIADSCLRDLRDQRLGIAHQYVLKVTALRKFGHHVGTLHPKRTAGTLNDDPIRQVRLTHKGRDPDEPLPSDDADLDRLAALSLIKETDHSGGRKIDELILFFGFPQDLARSQKNVL